jgi:hypothetical protein
MDKIKILGSVAAGGVALGLVGEVNYYLVQEFSKEVASVFMSPFLEEPLKRGINKVSVFSTVIFSVIENIQYTTWSDRPLETFVVRCLLTTPMHIMSSKYKMWIGIASHVLFNAMAVNHLPVGLLAVFVYTQLALHLYRARKLKRMEKENVSDS